MTSNKKYILAENALTFLRNNFSSTLALVKEQYKKEWEVIAKNLSIYLTDYIRNSHKHIVGNGYFLPLSNFGFSYIEKINSYINDKDYENLNIFVLGLLKEKENLNYLYQDWENNKYFKNREKFIKKGIEAHLNSDYISSVPILLPHIEGVFYEFFLDVGLIKKDHTKKFQGNTAVSILKNVTVVNMASDLDKIYFRKFVNKIRIFDYNSDSNGYPNRGQILHGLELNYDNEVWSAQIIFLLNFVFDFTGKKYSILSNENGMIKMKEIG